MDYRWKPIEQLLSAERSIDLSDLHPLVESWRQLQQRLRTSNEAGLRRFNERLVRSLSIETGILERIYDLDRGTTEALIRRGFVEDLIERSSTNIEPSKLVDILRDQEAAIQLVHDLVSRARPLTRGALLDLHSVLTRHQDTTRAVDQFGNSVEIPLRKGAFKIHPNNPKRPDGSIHEYCPPEQVDSEVENLLKWLTQHETEGPLLVSAWLHHRFTQIHPFQDGNGRVARVLITYVLLRAGLLPLVIDRDRREDYLNALENADFGDLTGLVGLFSALEKNAVLQALSVDLEAEGREERSLTQAMIESLQAKFSRRREARRQEFLGVNRVARELRDYTSEIVRRNLEGLVQRVFEWQERPEVFVLEGGPDHDNSHWYKFEITSINEESKKWINFDEEHFFVKAAFRHGSVRLVLVVSFHHIGRELTGVMEATSFALIETFDEAEKLGEEGKERVGRKTIPTSFEPFVLTWRTQADAVRPSFAKWLDKCVAIALKEWGDRV